MDHKNPSTKPVDQLDPSRPDAKQLDLERARVENGPHITTNQGVVLADNDNSLKAGERGPTLLEDFILREKITHFDHERIPERVVHARGHAAHGHFQLYEPLTQYTRAKFLTNTASPTPVFCRFSTVGGSRGSADTVRDVRGFAVKFYTEEGVFDIVGNNIPVFFIQDAMKFPDFVHAVKPEPHNEIPQASSAHDTLWDFVTQQTETTHMVMWLMSPRAIPLNTRAMDGFGVNTYRLVNEEGKGVFIKWHWKALLGAHSLIWDEAQKLAGKDADFHRRDLWQAIEHGNFPEWELGVQIVEEADERKFDFDILDATKLWPEEEIPVRRIGKMTLNKNPDSYFSETEQVAFCVSHVVPGVDFSNDPLLQGRIFSYLDTQLSRIGVNFAQLPINRPTARVSNDQRDGKMQGQIPTNPVSYAPSGIKGCPMHSADAMKGFKSFYERIDANKIRVRSDSFKDHFSQATLFWNSQTDAEKKQIAEAFIFELSKVERREIRQLAIAQFSKVDAMLGAAMAHGLGEAAPAAAPPVPGNIKKSHALSMVLSNPKGVKTRKVGILALDGVDEVSLTAFQHAMKAAGVATEVISARPGLIHSAGGKELAVDKTLLTTGSIMYDAVFVPGGVKSVDALRQRGDAMLFVLEAFKHCKPIGATGEGVKMVQGAELDGLTAAPSDAPRNIEGVVLAADHGDAQAFTKEFLSVLAEHRYWDRQKDLIPA